MGGGGSLGGVEAGMGRQEGMGRSGTSGRGGGKGAIREGWEYLGEVEGRGKSGKRRVNKDQLTAHQIPRFLVQTRPHHHQYL